MNIKAYIVLDLLIILLLASCGKSTEMRQLLEHTDSLNREYAPLDTVSYMEKVAGYYDHWYCSDTVRLKAYYLLASVERDKGDSPLSIEHFNKAISFADTASADCDYRQVSKIYAQIALLLGKQCYPQKEIVAWEAARDYARKAKDTVLAIQTEAYRSDAYWILGQKKKAVDIAQKAYFDFLSIGQMEYAASCKSVLFAFYLEAGDYDCAKMHMDEYKKSSGFFDSHGNIAAGYELFYYYEGEYYSGMGRTDSALQCYYKVLNSTDIQQQKNAYKGLMSAYQTLDKMDSVAKYARLYTAANDSLNFSNTAREIIRAQALYDYSASLKKAKDSTARAYHLSLWVCILVIFIIIICGVYVIQKYKSKQKITELGGLYDKTVAEWKLYKEDRTRFETEKEKEIERLRRALAAHEKHINVAIWDAEQSLHQQEIVKRFERYVVKLTKPIDSEWKDLYGVVEKLMPNFYNKMAGYKNSLNDQQYKACILAKLGFSASSMQVLLGETKQNITNIRSRVNMKIFGDSSARTFMTNIRQL